jgi:NitT/TauT family transport system substrate-binding protein
MKTKICTGSAVMTIVLCTISWYAWRQAPSPPPTGMVETIVFGTTASGLFAAPLWVAERQGYFQQEGLDVDIRVLSDAKVAFDTMVQDGSLDMVSVAQTPVVWHSFVRNDYAIIAAMADSDNNCKLLARKDRGIHTPHDLTGKAIGVTGGTSGQFFLDMFLLSHGLNPAAVETIDLAAGALPQALVEGRVDAMATWEPHIFHAQRLLGANAFEFETHNVVRTKFYVVALRQFIARHPGALQKFLKALKRAETFIHEHNTAALEMAAQRIKMDRDLATVVWNDLTFRLGLDQSTIDVLETEARWVINHQFTAQTPVPNYLSFLFVDGLKAVKPGIVIIVSQ